MEEKKNENKSKNISKSNVVTILMLVIISIILVAVFIAIIINNNSKEAKASTIFGNESCNAILHMATFDLAEHTCKICGENFQDSSMREDICEQCANETGRCEFCGKKLSETIKQQREETLNQNK